MTRFGVCYANWGAPPIDIPPDCGEWAGFAHANYGMADEPLETPILTQGVATKHPGGVVLNHEETTPTPIENAAFLRKTWPHNTDLGTAIFYGADAAVEGWSGTHPIGTVAKSLRRRLPRGCPPQYAGLGLDGYPRPGYSNNPGAYVPWATYRLDRLAVAAKINRTPSWFFIDIQNQCWPEPAKDIRLWDWPVVEMQVWSWLPYRDRGVNLMVFAQAQDDAARVTVESAIVENCHKINVYVHQS
jgi:hypothetical protein